MASPYLTSNTLIDSIKRRAMIPESQSTFTDDDLLAFANEEVSLGLVPLIISMKEEFLVYRSETTLEDNKSNYPIPYRAVGNKLRDLFYKDTQGNLREMTRISPDDRAFYGVRSDLNFFYKFFLQGTEVIIIPEASANVSGSLQFVFYMRPNQLVAEDRVAIITAIDTDTGVITVDGVPSNITSGSLADFLQAKSGHKTLNFDISVVGINSTLKTITFDPDDLPDDLVVGDHIATAGECIIPQIPDDLQQILAQRVALRCLESMGDSQGLQNAAASLARMEQNAGILVDDRVEGAPQKLINLRGLLRNSRIRRRGRW